MDRSHQPVSEAGSMTNLRKAAQQALEALDGVLDTYGEPLDRMTINGGAYEALYCRDAITALRAALAQPEQEPVAYQWLGTSVIRKRIPKTAEADAWQPLYTAPPQPQPLTEEEIYKLFGYNNQYGVVPGYAMSFVRAVEKAHGIGGEHES